MATSNSVRGNKRQKLPKPGSARYRTLQRLRSPLLVACDVVANKAPRPKRKPARAAQAFPQFFAKPENQAAAEWIAHNYTVDKLLGIAPHVDRPHYQGMDREAVDGFLQRLDVLTAGRSPVAGSPGA